MEKAKPCCLRFSFNFEIMLILAHSMNLLINLLIAFCSSSEGVIILIILK